MLRISNKKKVTRIDYVIDNCCSLLSSDFSIDMGINSWMMKYSIFRLNRREKEDVDVNSPIRRLCKEDECAEHM